LKFSNPWSSFLLVKAFKAVERGEAMYGVVPIENSASGADPCWSSRDVDRKPEDDFDDDDFISIAIVL